MNLACVVYGLIPSVSRQFDEDLDDTPTRMFAVWEDVRMKLWSRLVILAPFSALPVMAQTKPLFGNEITHL